MLLHTPAELPVGAEVTRGGRQQRLLHTPVEHPFGAESSPHSAASMGNAAEQSRPANPAANGGGSASASAPGTSLAGRGEEGSAGGPSREAALGQGRVSSADGQNRQQQSAGATAPISVPDVPDAPPVKPEDAPAIILQALLGKLSSLDASSFFQDPVTEAVAPGYFDFIKRPMCFQRMREKLLSREYRTWRSFVEDFELICSNASTYNRKNSKIHKAAATLLRAGRKLLQSSELEGRKAVQLLHPDGPRAAAREDEAEAAACATPFSSGPLSNASCAAGNLKAPDSAGPLQSGAEADRALDAVTTYEALVDELCEAGGAAGGGAIGGYSSFSDTDLEEEAASGPPDPLLQPALAPVTWMEWGNILKLEGKRRPSDWGEDTQEGSVPFIKEEQEEDRGREANMDEAEEAGINWAALRRGLEWRHRWLELRCRELASQAARQKAALRRLGVWAKGQGHGPSSLSTAPPSSLLAIARPSQPHKRRRRTAWSLGPGAKSLEEVPFFAHHALGRLPSSLVQGKECGSFSTIGDDEEEGAVIYEDLERVSARLQQLRATLVGQRGHRSKAKRSSSAAGEASKAARGRSGSLALRPGSPPGGGASRYRGNAPSALRIPTKSDQDAGKSGTKRKRSQSDALDSETVGNSSLGSGAPKFERPPVADIFTPAVRMIDIDELQRRSAAVRILRERALAETAGDVNLPPALLVDSRATNGDTDVLLAEAVGSDGAREGSSSEDTDDETYLRRHHDMEERERAAVTERANKTAEKRRAQQQQSLSSKGHDPSRGGSNGPLGKPGFAPVWSGGS